MNKWEKCMIQNPKSEEIAKFIIELNRQGRTEDIVKMAADSECRKKLLEEFHFD